MPFIGDCDADLFKAIKKGRFEFDSPDWDEVSETAKDRGRFEAARCHPSRSPVRERGASRAVTQAAGLSTLPRIPATTK